MIDVIRPVGSVRLRFVWSGGPYIDVHEVGHTAVEVINVWDSAAGKPAIPVTQAAFRRKVDSWIDSYADAATPLQAHAALEHDVITHWRGIQRPNPVGRRVGQVRPRRFLTSVRWTQ